MTDSNYTHLVLVADCSSSMSFIAAEMNQALATYLEEQSKFDGKLLVDTWTFASYVRKVGGNQEPADVRKDLIRPSGSTALLDAIGNAVTDLGLELDRKPEAERPGKVIVVVITDGEENSSQYWTASRVKQIIETQKNVYAWEFVFLGANIDAVETAARFGIDQRSALNYDANAAGVRSMASSLSGYTTTTRSGLVADFSQSN